MLYPLNRPLYTSSDLAKCSFFPEMSSLSRCMALIDLHRNTQTHMQTHAWPGLWSLWRHYIYLHSFLLFCLASLTLTRKLRVVSPGLAHPKIGGRVHAHARTCSHTCAHTDTLSHESWFALYMHAMSLFDIVQGSHDDSGERLEYENIISPHHSATTLLKYWRWQNCVYPPDETFNRGQTKEDL